MLFDDLNTNEFFVYDGWSYRVVRVAEYFDEPCCGLAINLSTGESVEFRGSEIVEFIG